MRIDNNRANLDAITTIQAHAEGGSHKGAARTSGAGGGDQVSLSTGVQLATSAVSAAERSPDVRPEAVERAKALLESGKLGNDPDRLADALIDRALSKDE